LSDNLNREERLLLAQLQLRQGSVTVVQLQRFLRIRPDNAEAFHTRLRVLRDRGFLILNRFSERTPMEVSLTGFAMSLRYDRN
jgi:ubiquinone/menaquinone biosynthesis C-methylase UbiE